MSNEPIGKLATRRALRGGIVCICICVSQAGSILAQKPALPEAERYVHPGENGLIYQAGPRGDRIADFSVCGYRGGGIALPSAPVQVTISPASGDNTARIQAAIDYVSQLPTDEHGLRGAVQLAAGRHFVSGSLRIQTSGVVLCGVGSDVSGTTIVATGTDRRPLIRIYGKNDRTPIGEGRDAVSAYVPVGAVQLKIDNPAAFKPGDTVIVERPSAPEWIAALGMDVIGAPKAGFKWVPERMNLRWDRVVRSASDDAITLDAPITTALDPKYGGGQVWAYRWPGRISQVGVENLRCESEFDQANSLDEQHAWDAIMVESAENAWVRSVQFAHFAGSAVNVLDTCKHVTVENCASREPVSEVGGSRRQTFYTAGQMCLFHQCSAENGQHDFAVGSLAGGPNAFVDCQAKWAYGFSGPIESWASGVLYDNVTMDGGGLSLTNLEIELKGAGWAAANCVLWQCTAPIITCRAPPDANNWAIGCWGQFIGDGSWRTLNEFVKPDSLYQAQLADRLGVAAVEKLARSTTASDASAAKSIDDLPPQFLAKYTTAKPPSVKPLKVENGWLVCDGRLLVGRRVDPDWWNSSILPQRGVQSGAGVTRFVPGHIGQGTTDELDELTDSMVAHRQAVLEHHWGLWYDRRRDDHEMIRRIDGDVWPPFYEQPWARSGQGRAWDGLSKYDLTKFNPWYFQRLGQFAELCDQKGLALVHFGYFQHNVLEAGGHWVDFPFRPANNIQDVGLPEPPPFENNKRIFMASKYYDMSNPARRQLHELYIRHYLDELSRHTNVIYLTSDEFSGPCEFAQFWLDTVTAWEKETGKRVLVGLSAPKDVQDAILADESRAREVSVIDMRWWWYTAAGEAYAPLGGQDLSPRQHYREWRGNKRFSTEQTVRQVREYRKRFPDKAVMYSPYQMSGWDPWAVLIAGGSLAELPTLENARFLADVPKLKPYEPADGLTAQQWALGDPEGGYVVYSQAGATIRLDLSPSKQRFAANWINPATGKSTPLAASVDGGKIVEFEAPSGGPCVLWLTRN